MQMQFPCTFSLSPGWNDDFFSLIAKGTFFIFKCIPALILDCLYNLYLVIKRYRENQQLPPDSTYQQPPKEPDPVYTDFDTDLAISTHKYPQKITASVLLYKNPQKALRKAKKTFQIFASTPPILDLLKLPISAFQVKEEDHVKRITITLESSSDSFAEEISIRIEGNVLTLKNTHKEALALEHTDTYTASVEKMKNFFSFCAHKSIMPTLIDSEHLWHFQSLDNSFSIFFSQACDSYPKLVKGNMLHGAVHFEEGYSPLLDGQEVASIVDNVIQYRNTLQLQSQYLTPTKTTPPVQEESSPLGNSNWNITDSQS